MKNKNIIRVEKNKDYVVINRTVLNDKRLSWKAKGLMAYMLAMPDDWVFYLEELETHSTDGETSFRSGFNELKKFGYVIRKRDRVGDGTFEWRTIVHEVPHSGNLLVDNQRVDNLHVDNHELLSIEEVSIEEVSIEEVKDPFSKERKIFDYYISKEIIIHKTFTTKMKQAVRRAFNNYEYTEQEIMRAIDNYSIAYKSDDYYFNTKYDLIDMMREKDLRQFQDEKEPLNNFRIRTYSKADEEQSGIDDLRERLRYEERADVKHIGSDKHQLSEFQSR